MGFFEFSVTIYTFGWKIPRRYNIIIVCFLGQEDNMEQNNRKPILKQIIYIIIAVLIVGMICVGAYGYLLVSRPDVITLGVGEEYTLSPREDVFTVRSYNADIVSPSVSSTIKATATGDAVVCVRYTYFDRDFYRFNVVQAPSSVTLSTTQVHLGVGETYTLKATCDTNGHSFAVSYSSSDEKVATISANGVLSANSVGECEITAYAYNGVSATCTLTVSKAPKKFYLSDDSITLGTNEDFTIEPVFDDDEYSGSVEYSSSDDTVASISDGVITAKNVGECTITATTHNDKTAKCTVTVKKLPDEFSLLVLDKYDIDTDIKVITDIVDDYAAGNIEVSVSDDTVLSIDDDDTMLIHCNKKGEATITLTLSNGVTAQKTVTVGDYTNRQIDFDILNQFPTLPTGCEVVSLTSVLNHYGFDVSMTTMADEYMPRSESAYYNINPHEYYIGTPYTWDGFGCFSGCIVKTAQNYFEDKNIDNYVAVDISGCSIDELQNYLQNDIPVITWVTSGFVTPTNNGSWYVDNELITWCNNEHCLVTTGYDINADTVTVADDSGGYSYTVSTSQFKEVFEGMGSMAVVVLEK